MPLNNIYGAAVIGEEAAAAQSRGQGVQTAVNQYGPAITGEELEAPPPPPAEGAETGEGEGGPGADQYLNLDEFRATITAENVIEKLQVELSRPAELRGPRKGALESLRKVEREGQNRPHVIEMIDNGLEEIEREE